MGFIDKIQGLIDDISLHKEFNKSERIIKIQLIKGNRKIIQVINDSENNVFIFFGKAKEVISNDIIIDERNLKYIVREIEENCKMSLQVDGSEQKADIIKVHYSKFENDTESIFDVITQRIKVSLTVNATIQEINNSTINSIGAITNSINQNQDFKITWHKIKHDLNWRFDYKEYGRFIYNVDNAISAGSYEEINQKEKVKAMKQLGGFLGEFLGSFVGSLVSSLCKS